MNSAKDDVEALMAALMPFAERMLTERGEFYPFAGGMKPNGEIVNVAGYDGREKPPSQDIINILKANLRADASVGTYKATAILYDVRITLPESQQVSDAIAVALDHRNDYSKTVLFPYTLERGKVNLAAPFSERGAYSIFGQ